MENLFPNFDQNQVEAAVAQYTGVSGLPTALDQAIAVMGEGEYNDNIVSPRFDLISVKLSSFARVTPC